MKIVILGNSVGLRVRPRSTDGFTYARLLEDKSREVINMCIGRATSGEILETIDESQKEIADCYIVNLGCVDAATREIPLWYSDVCYDRRKVPFGKSLAFFYYNIIKRFRPFFVKLRGNKPWIKEEDFKSNMRKIVKALKSSKVIVLGINRGTDRIEKELPGTLKNYRSYNTALRAICEVERIEFIDPNEFLDESCYPDGVHYNQEGHRIIAKEIERRLG